MLKLTRWWKLECWNCCDLNREENLG